MNEVYRGRRIGAALTGLAGLALLLYLSGFFSGFFEGFVSALEGHVGMPSCGSSLGLSDAKRVFEGSPSAKTLGIALVAVKDAKTISATAQKVECSATAILNNAQQAAVSYSFASDPSLGWGQYMVQVSVDTNNLRPYP